MLHARLREIRKAKGLTLQDVAERIKPEATTAQTIGRLETGMRSLTVEWIEKIADALSIDPAELFAFPKAGDIVINGAVMASGTVVDREEGLLPLRPTGRNPVAVRFSDTMGQYRAGDVIVCEKLVDETLHRAAGCDCLVMDDSGTRHFGKVLPTRERNLVILAPTGADGSIKTNVKIQWAAPAIALMRALAQ